MFYLFTLIVHTVFWVLIMITATATALSGANDSDAVFAFGGVAMLILIVWLVVALALMLPTYAVWARRLHDMGQSGHWLWLNLVSLGIVPLVMAFIDSQPGPNAWGPNPKGLEYPPPVQYQQ